MEDRSTPHPDNAQQRPERKTFAGRKLDQDDTTSQDASDTPTVGSEPELRIGAETGFDRIVGPEEAGLGGGLDQAEEARLGVTDEELAEMARTRRNPKK